MITPLVSIIVPNYNHSKFIQKRIDSIFSQTFRDFEVIILDDASTDESVSLINQAVSDKENVSLILNSKNSGSTFVQWNKGIALAKGKYIWMAESDDYASDTFLSSMVPLMENNQDCAIAYSQSKYIHDNIIGASLIAWTNDLSNTLWVEDFKIKGHEAILKYWIHKNIIINASAALFNREAYQKSAANQNVNYQLCGDWFTWIALMKNGNLIFKSETLNFYRRHEGTVTSKWQSNLKIKKEINEIHNFCYQHFVKSEADSKLIIQAQFNNWRSFIERFGKFGYLSQIIKSRQYFKFPKKFYLLKFIPKFIIRKLYGR
ncbi:glycosyltransferase family 2 protein [Pedobacter agri]|uniref:glycosyltransferase family 2 protein n=1 Tax=Pedobacter agri TaxID=454586 RepID=UPI00292DB1D3|nr:glycosyltransferase family 2 protein [Pedobacter agri]